MKTVRQSDDGNAGKGRVLVISTCSENFSEDEFVRPVVEIAAGSGFFPVVMHYSAVGRQDVESAESIIICGTALKDFKYLEDIDRFSWLETTSRPVLGICAGMQIIARAFGCGLEKAELAGTYRVNLEKEHLKNALTRKEEFEAYFLNTLAVSRSSGSKRFDRIFEAIAVADGVPCIIKLKGRKLFGCLFHPEVLNHEILVNFLNILAEFSTL